MFSIIFFILNLSLGYGATIAIIDTGFDLDHDYLKPNILTNDTENEVIDYYGWDFFDNSHLKESVIKDKDSLQDILKYRDLRAKGHKQGLTLSEFEWYKKKNSNRLFMEKVKRFKKHSHGTFVAGIALREGENITIFPIRGLNIPTMVYTLNDSTTPLNIPPKGKTPEEKFHHEITLSIDRISKKFSKICKYVSKKNIDIVNASYGITYKSIVTKFRERYRDFTTKEITESQLKILVDNYFTTLYRKGEKTVKKYPHILFIFSAGNSGLDNDLFHHYPSKIKADNTLTVAAMNGEYLATFSNYGKSNVDIGAPGVAIPSLIPKVYINDGTEIYSPSSGTSMAAPYISNLAAQIKNGNSKLGPIEIKKIILGTGEVKEHLRGKIISASIANNKKALKASLLSRDIPLDQAVNLAASGLIPIEDKISTGISPAVSPEDVEKKIADSIPSIITPAEVDEEPSLDNNPTKSKSSLEKDQVKLPQDNSRPPPSEFQVAPEKFSDLVPSNQSEGQSPKPFVDLPASASQPQ